MSDFNLYNQLLNSNLFLQTPLINNLENNNDDKIDEIYKSIRLNNYQNSFKQYLQLAEFVKFKLLSIDNNKSINNLSFIYKIYKLWELRLLSLIFANELSIAQQESKKLSSIFDNIFIAEQSDEKFNNEEQIRNIQFQSQQSNQFPKNITLSLKLLIIRLRSQGANNSLLTEYYQILFDIRKHYKYQDDNNNNNNNDSIYNKSVKILSFAISGSLIAKREYSTFLTHSNSIINSFEISDDKDQNYLDNLLLLSSLISLMKGDWDLANNYFNQISKLSNVLIILQQSLIQVNPILDNKQLNKLNGEELIPNKESIMAENIDQIQSLEGIFELIKNQLITGRILCSLCSLIELELRKLSINDDKLDLLHIYNGEFKPIDSNELDIDSIPNLFHVFSIKPNKLYTFE